ncbi:MAG: HD domain-containing protein [Candidatus Omnitrophota bacterium]
MQLPLASLKKRKILKIILNLANHKHITVYLVGGCIRDWLLKREEILDFDFAVNSHSLKFAKELSKKLKAPFVLLDEPHGCARIVVKNNSETINLDFSDFRASTIEEDLRKRDFSINALALKLDDIFLSNKKISDSLLDPYNGKSDLKKRRVCFLDYNTFSNDPLRMLRAFSISARLNFKIDKKTIVKIKKESGKIRNVSRERVREEFFKLFSIVRSYPYFSLLEKSSLLEKIIPEIKLMYRLKQGAYHHLDVWRHTLETLRQLEMIIISLRSKKLTAYLNEEVSGNHKRFALLKFSAILHDIAKPATFSRVGRKIHFYGHERLGAKMAETIAERLRFSTKEKKALKNIIYWHLRPGHMADLESLSERALFRYFRDCQEEAVSVALLSLADQRATRGKLQDDSQRKRHEKLIRFLIIEYFRRNEEHRELPLINGNVVMKSLHLEPGPMVGKILNELKEAQAEGAIRTKMQAIAWAKRFYKQLSKA